MKWRINDGKGDTSNNNATQPCPARGINKLPSQHPLWRGNVNQMGGQASQRKANDSEFFQEDEYCFD